MAIKLIKKERIDTQVENQYVWSFEVPENMVYAISISARCKNWIQNFKLLFNDDDLAIQIDDYLYAEIKGKKREFSSPGSWNGNETKGETKNVLVILPLKVGIHKIKFWVDGKPTLEEIRIYGIEESEIDLVASNIIAPGKFLNVIFKNVKIEELAVMAKTEVGSKLEIKVDGKVEKNLKYKKFEKWYWYGQELKGNSKDYTLLDTWDGGLHFLELNSQGKPEIESIKLKINLENIICSSGFVRLYKDIIPNDSVNVRMQPTNESESLMMVASGEKVEIVSEKIIGKYIINLSNVWYESLIRGVKGYILSSFVEISGQERDVVIFKIKEQAKTKNIDPDFAVALAGCESHYKPYAVSKSGALGIFQLTGIVRTDLEQRFNLKISEDECFDVDKNITAGLTYLQWLLGVYRGTKDEYKKVAAAWNAGKSLIPVNGSIVYEHIKDLKKREEAKNLVNCVEQNKKTKTWQNIAGILIILFLGIGFLFPPANFYYNSINSKVLKAETLGAINSNTKFVFEHPDIDSNIKSITVTAFSPEKFIWNTKVEFVFSDLTYFKEYSGALYNAYISYHLGFGFPKLIIIRGEGQLIFTSILEFDSLGKNVTPIDFVEKDGTRNDALCCSYMIPIPMNNGVQYDIGMPVFSTSPIQVKVYRYNNSENAFVEERLEYIK